LNPTVSIILPVYNGQEFIVQSINSCLSQTFQDFELIIIDDGSTDATPDLIQAFKDARIRLKRTDNAGLPSALNAGFSMAKGDFWTWTSDDNLYLPWALQKMVEHSGARQNQHVCADYVVINSLGKVTGYNAHNIACFLYSAEQARSIGPYRSEYTLVEDADFFIRLRHRFGQFHRIEEPLYLYRQHGNTLSAKSAGTRAIVSLKLHLAHLEEGMITQDNFNVKDLFLRRMHATALYNRPREFEQIWQVAVARNVPFLESFQRSARFYFSPLGRALLWGRTKVNGLRQRLSYHFYFKRRINKQDIEAYIRSQG